MTLRHFILLSALLLAMLAVLYSSVSQAAQEQCRSNSQLIV